MPPKGYIRKSYREKLTDLHNWIGKFQSKHGYAPSIREIADAYSTSTSVARRDLQSMERLGLARLTPQISRSIVLLPMKGE